MAAVRWAMGTGSVLVALVASGLVASGLVGCGEAKPITKDKSKYRPAEETVGLPPAEVPRGIPGEQPDNPAASPRDTVQIPQPPTTPEVATNQTPSAEAGTPSGTEAAAPGTPGKSPGTPTKSPATPGKDANGKEIVVSTEVKQMVVTIQELASSPPPGNTPEEQAANFSKQLTLIVELCQRILQSNADPKVNDFALSMGSRALQRLQAEGDVSATTRMAIFATAVAKNPNEDVARKGRLMLFDASMAKQLGSPKPDAPAMLKAVEELLATDAGDEAVLELTSAVCQMLGERGHKTEAIQGLRAVATAYKDHKDDKLAKFGKMQESAANLLELDAKSLLKDVLAKKPDSDAKLLAGIKGLLQGDKPSTDYVQPMMDIIEQLERDGNLPLAQQFYDLLDTSFAAHEDPNVTKFISRYVELGRKRFALIGQPFAVNAVSFEGADMPGKPLDLKPLLGKVVLVNCWGSFVGPSRDQIPTLRQVTEKLKPNGLEVVSLMFDTDLEILQKVLSFSKSFIPWTPYISPDIAKGEKFEDWHDTSLAKELNLFALPLYILVDKEGKIDSIYHYKLDSDRLSKRLQELLGLPEAPKFVLEPPPPLAIENNTIPKAAPTPTEAPTAPAPAPNAPANPAPAPAEPKAPEANKQGRLQLFSPIMSLVSFLAAADEPAKEEAKTDEPNPYLAKPDQTAAQLTDWLLRMLDKPKTIQGRPGFAAAIAEACDRILADKSAKETQQLMAIETKLGTLHRAACNGDEKADAQLTAFVAQLKDDTRPRVARETAFFHQERKVLNASEAKSEEIAALLKELQEYYGKEKLAAKHLRMASATVDLINKLEDGDAREKHFSAFGEVFAKSTDKELARYGKKLAKKPETKESDLVGKPLELAGNTAAGNAFAWDKYRGKVVIVDFWATWCGPCRKEMPNVKALREKLKDKGFEVVGVSVDKDLEALDTYLQENDIPWETLCGDEAGELAEKYGVRGIPTMMLIDQKGNVVAVAHNVAALAPQAEKLLAK